ncbi:glycosyltransferase family 2 protein [Pontibacter akesuensis]|uniref:Glycosyltransferase involved in cell wall bisynthesis n=1 Tax=Pontibacter akesuensis TaxID=388950 RepID=A0A1I7KMM1_9BACT|nr:glycosyltransferase family 2 protein [Pontibacter akesuensis]GHA77546.1 glycosyl transferase [Pontibacter akesuensis]SFU98656.1 Glycosyltransferase involved in cell wall bisynthesis [Pontibacter akesuensis]
MQYNYDISVVVPLFNEEESLPELVRWIKRVMHANEFSYEVILVDDGSTDRSWDVINTLSAEDKAVKGISFNRNYGKSAALNEGFRRCSGEVVITMDADLQDSPEEIPGLYDMIKNQRFDLVSGWKKKRFDPLSKTIPTKLFNGATRKLSGIQLHDFNCGLKAYRQLLVKSIEVHGEMHRYIPVIAKWNGFTKIGEKVVQHQERKYGTTKFGLERFVYGFLDLLSITFVSRFKKRPMHFFGSMGTLMFVVGLGITIWLIAQKMLGIYQGVRVRDIVDQPLFFLALVAVILGVQLFLAGFLAEMISMASNKRNEYLIRDRVGALNR